MVQPKEDRAERALRISSQAAKIAASIVIIIRAIWTIRL